MSPEMRAQLGGRRGFEAAAGIMATGISENVQMAFGAGRRSARRIAYELGIQRMQGGAVMIMNSGTLNYNADRQSPAGRPNDSRIGQ